jgi:AAA+ ATPase superfamily predicted ATPase
MSSIYNQAFCNLSSLSHGLFGRDNELQLLLGYLKTQKSITFLEGEAGIGKSALLDEFYRRLLQYEDPTKLFVGYFDKSKILLGSSAIYPFVTILEDLLKYVKNTEEINERIKGTMKRIVWATVEFGTAKGKELAGAILQDVANKLGLEKTFDLLKDFLKVYEGQKSAAMLAEDYISKNQDEAVLSYVGIFDSLANEFKDRIFVLIFDQFGSTKKIY